MPRRQRSEIVGEYRVFRVLRHEIVGDDEGAPYQAYTFECSDWAAVVPVTPAGNFVLVRQYRHAIDAFTLEVPGGVIDPGESPEVAAARELREETGYAAETLRSLGSAHPNPPLQNNVFHMFLGLGAKRVGEPQFDVGERCEVLEVSPVELRKLLAEGGITHALVLLALERALRVLGREAP